MLKTSRGTFGFFLGLCSLSLMTSMSLAVLPAKVPKKPILVVLKADSNLPKCIESTPDLTRVIRANLEKQGFGPVWASATEIATLDHQGILDRVSDWMKKRNVENALVARCYSSISEDDESMHAAENRYTLQTLLKSGEDSFQNQEKNLGEGDSLAEAEVKIMMGLFSDLESKSKSKLPPMSERPELFLSFKGMRDFAQYSRIKALIQTQLSEVWMEERKISRSEIIFSVRSVLSRDELIQKVANLLQSERENVTVTAVEL